MVDAAGERAAALAALGLQPDATPAQVAAAYRRLARATHPDRCPDGDAAVRFAALTDAYRHARVASEPPVAPLPPAPAPTPPPAVRREPPSSYLTSGSHGPDLIVGPVRVVPWPRPRPRTTGEGSG